VKPVVCSQQHSGSVCFDLSQAVFCILNCVTRQKHCANCGTSCATSLRVALVLFRVRRGGDSDSSEMQVSRVRPMPPPLSATGRGPSAPLFHKRHNSLRCTHPPHKPICAVLLSHSEEVLGPSIVPQSFTLELFPKNIFY
jgi:hypothetical protein